MNNYPAINPWTDLDDKAVALARALAADSVQNAGHGHPGTAIALAPVAYTLFQRIMRHNPKNSHWLGRDRFVLSAGHSSITLYTQLFYSGYGLEMKDLQEFRREGSLTPGHPEFGHTNGVEITTGPLGSGISSAVGMAMAARYEKGLLDPNSTESIFDHDIWVIASDGDLEEGMSGEASSLAGTQALGNLKVVYDDNRISIEGDTHVSFTEDVSARYRAYGWKVIEVAAQASGNVDRDAFEKAALEARAEKNQPVLIRLHSVIAWPAPKARGTAKSHGSALGDEDIANMKKELGLNPDEKFAMPAEVLTHIRKVVDRGVALESAWQKDFATWENANPANAQLLARLLKRELPVGFESVLPNFEAGKDLSTRVASGKVINAIASILPEFWGGSADLAESNNTTIEEGKSFLPTSSQMKDADPFGRIIHFGIREHAMGAILNGIALHGLSRAFGGTFLVFSDYMRGSVRLAALMNIPSTFVWTHDSIGLGEDGPTHQPIEHVASLRLIPNFSLIRPADANEVAAAWKEILIRNKPAGLALSRQNLPTIDRTEYASASNLAKGAYVLKGSDDDQAIIIASGSEVQWAIAAQIELAKENIKVRVVSAPCLEWFKAQPAEYQESVLPKKITARVSVEAGVPDSWYSIIGERGKAISINHYGESASANRMFEKNGFSTENVVATVKSLLK